MESTVLVKAFALIEALANGAVGLAELAATAGVTKPTAHRVLQSMVALQYVEAMGEGHYCLTGKLRQLTLGLDERTLISVAEKPLRKLWETTGETINLGVVRANRVIYLTVLESTHSLRRVARVNDDDDVFTTALGRVIVAHLPEATADRMLAAVQPERRTPKTVIVPAAIRKILAEARRSGVAVEHDQTDLGVTCLAAPVMGNGSVIAAVSLSAPTARAAEVEAKWIKALRACAAEVTAGLKAFSAASA